MTITVTAVTAGPFTGTGAAQSLPFGFKAYSASEVEVISVVSGVETVVSPSAYEVSLNAGEGGSVSGVFASGATLYVRAAPALEQEMVFTDTGSRLASVNEALDRERLRVLALGDRVTRTLDGATGIAADIALIRDAAVDAAESAQTARDEAVAATANKADKDFGNVLSVPYVSKALTEGGRVNSRALGITPDAAADRTALLQALADRNDIPETVVFEKGVYRSMGVNINSPVWWNLSAATIKLHASSIPGLKLVDLVAGAEGSQFEGVHLDGNRDALIGDWAMGGRAEQWIGWSSRCADITVKGPLRLSNFLDYPAILNGDRGLYGDIIGYRNAGGIILGDRDIYSGAGYENRDSHYGRILTRGTADSGAPGQYQHCVTIFGMIGGSIQRIEMREQGGTVSGGSTWCSGLTVVEGRRVQIGDICYASPLPDDLVHLPVSLVGLRDSQIARLIAYDFAGQGFEYNALEGVQIGEVIIDGNYRATAAVPFGSDISVGVLESNYGHYEGQVKKSISGSRDSRIGTLQISRMANAGHIKTRGVTYDDIQIDGMIKDGMNIFPDPETLDYSPAFRSTRPSPTIGRYSATGCGKRGLLLPGNGGGVAKIADIYLCDNGQDSTQAADSRSGVLVGGGDGTQSLRIESGLITDRQSYTLTDAVTWRPGATDADNRKVVTIFDVSRIGLGYRITLVGVNGGADATGWVRDIAMDDVTIQFDAPVDFAVTGHTAALSGTWTGAADALTLTGVGGSLSTELSGPLWLTDGAGNYAQAATRGGTDSTLTLFAPFPVALAGATLYAITTDLVGVPSQQKGVRAFGAVNSLFLGPALSVRDNISVDYEISDKSKLMPGSVYTDKTTTTLSTGSTRTELQINVPRNHAIVGLSGRIDTAVGTATDLDIKLIASDAVTVLAEMASNVGLTKNSKFYGAVGAPLAVRTNDSADICAITNVNASAGAVTLVTKRRVDGLPVLADLP